MKIKMLVSIAGPDFALSSGDETERFGDAEAARLVAAGYAIPIAEPKVERATRKAPAQEQS
ncbi:hypothetical protein V5F44_11150 [Xanthobacter sp. V2C-8]|uniref:hypothetical protein n=1 Tax=Xanthobacter albus TaxID=3119929 RepID=UPI003728EF52